MNNIQTSSKVVHHPSFVSFYPRHRFAIFLKPLDAHDYVYFENGRTYNYLVGFIRSSQIKI